VPEESSFRLTEVTELGDGTGLSSNRRPLLLPIVSRSNIFRRSGAGKCFSTSDWNTPLHNIHTQHQSLKYTFWGPGTLWKCGPLLSLSAQRYTTALGEFPVAVKT